MKRSKYGAVRIEIDGIRFDSMREAHRYKELKLLDEVGEISCLELQPKFVIQGRYKKQNGRAVREISYFADFRYTDNRTGAQVVEDVKGFKTDVYKLKKKLVEAKFGIEIVEVN